jgi:hypothetical protein
MSRKIHLADSKGRDAEVVITSFPKRPLVKTVTQSGEETRTVRVLKSSGANSYEALTQTYADDEAIAQAIINGDPEIDLQMTGRFIRGTSRVYIDRHLKPVSRIEHVERVHAPDGSVKEERTPKELLANVLGEHPLRPGKMFPKAEIYNKLVFAKKYQIRHTNGLTFDFLFELSKQLHDQNSIMMIGGGAKGNEPLVFQDGGKSYRGFLEGRVKDASYILLLHLSNLEVKAVQ